MKLLTIDPSSTLTGYAVMTDPETIEDCGYLRPGNPKGSSIDRTDSICDSLELLVWEHKPDHVMIEVPSGHVRVTKFGAQGLTLYAFAAGAQHAILRRYVQVRNAKPPGATLWRVDEQAWTKGRTKSQRAEALFSEFPKLRKKLAADTGGDIADALGLGLYWWHKVWKLKANRP